FNILNYRNFYNGGGVAIGDINRDGLPDFYFTANMQPNRLYLNKGNWQFEDITEKAGVGGSRAWSTGVTMVDINADGLLDIYVCNSGDVAGDNKENELFINQGDLTFTEAAAEWGLNNRGFSTHASFFDYDQDGDLDCYLLNNSFKSPDRIELYRKPRTDVDEEGGDKLLRNEGNRFVDVTEEAGIYSSNVGFGLGVSVSDINGDMLPDIYVSNDFWERDYLYINQGDGTFSEELEQRISKASLNSMGADIADLNNDGFPEIMTTDMLPEDNFRLRSMTQFEPYHVAVNKIKAGYYHQYVQNCLQLNNGDAHFQEVGYMANVAATDWSWGTLLFDFNLDGLKDIFVSNGIQKDLTDLDFVDFISDRAKVEEIVRTSKEGGFRQFLPYMPSTELSNYAFLNQGNMRFANQAKKLGLEQPSFSNGSAYADLDADGDLDLVVNNARMSSFLYRNNAVEQGQANFLQINFRGPDKNPPGIGAKVQIYSAGKQQVQQHYLSRGFQSSVAPGLTFGLGKAEKVDSLIVTWPDERVEVRTEVTANQRLTLSYAEALEKGNKPAEKTKPLYTNVSGQLFENPLMHNENEYNDFDHEILLHRKYSEEGPQLLKGDVNGDGFTDMIILGAAGFPNQLLLQDQRGKFKLNTQRAFESDQELEATCGALLDADQDGDLDLLVGHGGNEGKLSDGRYHLRYYENDGSGNFSLNVESTPPVRGSMSVIETADFNYDGYPDIFVGGRLVPGSYGLIPASHLLLNRGDGSWQDVTTREIGQLGMVTAAGSMDIDGDQDIDLIVVGEWMPVTIFENTPEGLKKKTIGDTPGWWSALQIADLDRDGDEDIILGNWGLNSKFQASREKPLRLYVNDYDRNGKIEAILEWYPPGSNKAYPFATRTEMTKQLPQLKKIALKHAEYASRGMKELFATEVIEKSLVLRATHLESAILWNDSGKFSLQPLPAEAQLAPVFSILAEDLDGDAQTDLLLMGNLHALKPELGRLDANRGVFLKGMGNRKFKPLSSAQSGFWVEGQVRDIEIIEKPGGEKRILVARNKLPLQVYERR
ncbi:MAG: VCBS repeat-containing protein, partial [Cyclobacteriaceae bacterium]